MSGGALTSLPRTTKFGEYAVASCLLARKAAVAKLWRTSQSLWCSETVFASILFIVRWNLSTWFVDGSYGVVRSFSMPKSRQTSPTILPSTSLPWSLKIESGAPNLVNSCSTRTYAIVSASLLRSGKSSVHLEKECMHVRIQILPLSDFGCGPRLSLCTNVRMALQAKQVSTAHASVIYLDDTSLILRTFYRNAWCPLSRWTSKIFAELDPKFSWWRSDRQPCQRGNGESLRLLLLWVTITEDRLVRFPLLCCIFGIQVHHVLLIRSTWLPFAS